MYGLKNLLDSLVRRRGGEGGAEDNPEDDGDRDKGREKDVDPSTLSGLDSSAISSLSLGCDARGWSVGLVCELDGIGMSFLCEPGSG